MTDATASGALLTAVTSIFSDNLTTPAFGSTLLHMEGWDGYSTFSDVTNEYTYNGFGTNAVIDTTAGRFGGNCLKLGNGTGSLRRQLGMSFTQAWMGFAHRRDRFGGADDRVASWCSGGTGTIELTLTHNNDTGILKVWRGDKVTLLATATKQVRLPQTAYHFYEWFVSFDGSAGATEVWVDGIPFIQATGLNTKQTTATALSAFLLCTTQVDQVWMMYDDLYVTLGPRLGDMRIVTRMPTSDATPNDGTPVGLPTLNWNPSDKGANVVLSNSNLDANGNGTLATARATSSKSAGKWVVEHLIVSTSLTTPDYGLGFANAAASLTTYLGNSAEGCMYWMQSTGTFVNGFTTASAPSPAYFGTIVAGDRFMLAIDLDAGKIWVGKNGTYANSGNPATGANPWITFTPGKTLFPAVSVGLNNCVGRFVTTPFYTLPSGFSAWDVGPTGHYSTVDENPANTTDYVTLPNVNLASEMFGLSAFPAAAVKVHGVRISATGRKSSGTNAYNISVVAKSGTAEAVSNVVGLSSGTTWASISKMVPTDPATGTGWTVSAATAMKAGVRVMV